MPPKLEKLKKAVNDWLIRNELDSDTNFYDIVDWRARGEEYLNDAELVLIFESGLYMVMNYEYGDLYNEFDDLVSSFGYYFELGDAWNMGFYKIENYDFSNENKTYSQKLKDKRWKTKANFIKRRANYSCEDCGKPAQSLEVHHCYYIYGYEPWEYPYDALRCLCRSCHETRSQTEFRMRGFMASLKHSEINVIQKFLQDTLYWYESDAVFELLAAFREDDEKLKEALHNFLKHRKNELDAD